jgi:hypothetical protein
MWNKSYLGCLVPVEGGGGRRKNVNGKMIPVETIPGMGEG